MQFKCKKCSRIVDSFERKKIVKREDFKTTIIFVCPFCDGSLREVNNDF